MLALLLLQLPLAVEAAFRRLLADLMAHPTHQLKTSRKKSLEQESQEKEPRAGKHRFRKDADLQQSCGDTAEQ